jgi:YARHG domain
MSWENNQLSAFLSLFVFFAAMSPAQAQSCGELWYARNAIYKNAGYCFNTPRGISTFGNAGCQYDRQEDVPLSANQRRQIADIMRDERLAGCPR